MSRWIDQTEYHSPEKGTRGNCAQACVASILGLTLDEVPNFIENNQDSSSFWQSLMDFFLTKGYCLLRFKNTPDFVKPNCLYLATGKTSLGVDHMVIRQADELVHDPSYFKSDLLYIENIWLLVPIDPA